MDATWKPWFLATRPKTLSAAFVPILVGTALAYKMLGRASGEIAVYAFFAAVCIQIGTNLVNDALDFKKGADTAERLGPMRMTQSGYLTMEQVLAGGMMCFGAALLFGIPLIMAGGWPIALIMVLSVLCGYLYTGGPLPLAYIGLGDLFVLVFFGFIATGAVFYLQGGTIGFAALLAGTQVGMLSMTMIAVNNLRDVNTDRSANKRTLPVRFGVTFGRQEITFLIFSPFFLNVFWIFQGASLAALLPLATLPIGVSVVYGVWRYDPSEIYNRFLGLAALLHLTFGALLSLGFLFG